MSTTTTLEQQQYLSMLEDNANLLQKSRTNLKKCPKARLTRGYVEARLKIIEEYWISFKRAHEALVKITPKEQKGILPYFLNEEFFIYEDLYNVLQGDLKDMLMDSTTMNTSTSSTATASSIVHLPKIQLPKFDGNYEGWPTFQDLYKSLVHDNSNLSDVQKLHYLKTSVTGEAETLLKHIQITSSNYTTAWKLLSTRYGNKRIIVNSIMKRLFNQKKMTSQSAVLLKGLLDTTTECLNNLQNLKVNTASWDLIIIHLLVQKLDPETHKSWEEHAYREDSDALPTWTDLKKFMESKFRTLELLTASKEHPREVRQIRERAHHVATTTTQKTSIMCKDTHTLCHCKLFIKMEPNERSEYVKNKHLCFNCLVPGHSVTRCKLPVSCQICHRRHHSLLHESVKNTEPAASPGTTQPLASQHVVEEEETIHVNTMIASHCTTRQGVALLATAIVEATNERCQTIPLRALIDQGSQATFISDKATQLLKLKRQPVKGTIVGVGSTRTEIKHVVQLQIRSQWDRSYSLPIQAYVMSKQLTTKLPNKAITSQPWPHIEGLNLADSSYLTPGSIDLLLGINEYAEIIQPDLIKGPPGTPIAQSTTLGWILFGTVYDSQPPEDTYLVMHHQVDVDEILKSIWEIEVDKNRHLTKEDQKCEDIYKKTTTRNKDGRYIVHLPFKTDSPRTPEGNTREIATQRFLQLERRLKKSPDLKKEYTNVINDYIQQEHMEIIPERERESIQSVYLPHHAVVRNDKETSRTRIVFDASCKGTNNISLNDELLVGPQLQEDLRHLLIKWRMKRVCFMADIKQMDRQILVTSKDTDFQRIIWRPNESDNLQEYRLLRVTFGTACAPYLAVRTLHQIAHDEGTNQPLVMQSIKNNFYMDDWLDGADDTAAATLLAKTVTDILEKGGFQLTKWSSNDIEFMKSIEQENRSCNAHINMNLDGTIKALGIVWNLNKDTFQYNISLSTSEGSCVTKRRILSDIQKLFDPLGWIAPSTVMAKIVLPKLWLEKVTWDENVSDALCEEWRQIRTDFANVKDIQTDRWLGTTETNKNSIQLHGFSDASMHAYAAVVYVRIETSNQNYETKLIAAKTRVAPLKTISLPRLELCGALLLSRLMKQIGSAMEVSAANMFAWTDSTIVMAWICGEPNRWKPFVANRVVEVVENLNSKHWYHVQSSDNPADIASRGMMLSELQHCQLWWRGPSWLSEKEIKISKQQVMTTDMELKTIKINTYHNIQEQETSMTKKFEMFNNLPELLKTITYCKRFLNCKKNKNTDEEITTQELENALLSCVKIIQAEEFTEEIERIRINKQVKRTSPLRSLNPYLDEEGKIVL